MKNLIKLLVLVLMLSLNSCSSTNHIKKTNLTDYVAFNASFCTRRPHDVDSDQTRFMVPLAIPNTSMTYLKHGKKFRADYSIDVRFYKDKKLFFNKKFENFLEVDTFKETKKDIIYLSTLTVLIAPGKYNLVEIVYKSDVREAKKICKNVEIPIYTEFSLGSFQLLHKSTLVSKSINYITNYHNLYVDKDSLYFITELYNVKQGLIKFKFDFYTDGRLAKTKYTEIILDSDADIYQLSPMGLQIIDLDPGEYVLKTEISDNFNNKNTTKTFFVIGQDIIKYTDKEWKQSITLLKYMLGYGGAKHLKKLKTKKDRIKAVKKIWDDRDNGEGLYVQKILFYTRVRFVNSRFGTNRNDGWKTDRGRVYIKFGRPANTISNPVNASYRFKGKGYEIWTYDRYNRVFVFVDTSRMGNTYRLKGVYTLRGQYLGMHEGETPRKMY